MLDLVRFLNHLLAVLSLILTTAGVVYYVKPTEPCAHSSSCPSNETCHTMDHYVSNSSYYFSPDHINVTLYFMCGVHNCTQHMDIHNLQKFTVMGKPGRSNVIIYMPLALKVLNDRLNITSNHTYRFVNVSIVRIENVTIFFISLDFTGKNCLFEVDNVNFHGYLGSMSPMVSVINVTNSHAMLKHCTFQHNSFIRIQSNAVLQVSDCILSSYNHAVYSVIGIDNSTLKLTGTMIFINNTVGDYQHQSCGGAISINSGYIIKVPKSIFTITNAYVNFNNNTATKCGGAIYTSNTLMTIYDNTNMTFTRNNIRSYYNNNGAGGGAMYLEGSHFITNTSIINFFHNSAEGVAYGGAIYLSGSNMNSEYGAISFVGNTCPSLGGAIFCEQGDSISVDRYSRWLFYNNSAGQGGALCVQLSGIIRVGSNSHIEFSHNTAMNLGGAVYVDDQPCLFRFNNNSSRMLFKENLALEGVGMHIYGASIKRCMQSFCGKNIVSYTPNLTNSLSPVSSNPKRICLCDSNGKQQCANISSIFVNWHKVYRGESFNISVVVVGYDFGVTIGTVNAGFMPSGANSKSSLHPSQYHQFLGSSGHVQCSNITYNIYSNNTQEALHEILCLHTVGTDVTYFFSKNKIKGRLGFYEQSKHTCLDIYLLTTPVLINITLLDGCPPGFTLTLKDQLYGCNCYPALQNNHFKCFIINNAGYVKWNSTMWVNAAFNSGESDGILLAHYCPLNYCQSGEKSANLGRDPNAQCANNHAGVLCGGCENNYSLAIGSSRCIMCSNDSHFSLFLFFAAAGFLLVIFIVLLNLTVTQGLINGLILYANILWTHKDVFFPSRQHLILHVFRIFIAWLNLDFGIETCLVVGLTAFWKTWLQFLFPLYIWFIAGVIIIACRYSSRLTNLIGDRAVPLLATLFFLSYTKLLRTSTAIFEFGELRRYPNDSVNSNLKMIVWYLDGSLPYCHYPHIYLFIAAMGTLIFCLSFTLFLLLIQCWRRMSHLRLLRWIHKFTPFYDAYFAPLKDKHHYWFGTLLLVRIALLVTFTATSSTSPLVSLLILQFTSVMLLFYTSIRPVYKSKLVRTLESVSLSNLIILVCSTLYMGIGESIFLEVSIAFAFIQFLTIITISLVKIFYNMGNKWKRRKDYKLLIH